MRFPRRKKKAKGSAWQRNKAREVTTSRRQRTRARRRRAK